MDEIEITPLPAADVDRLRPLWESMRERYRELCGDRLPIRPAEDSWRRRREEYAELLAAPGAFALGAELSGELVGYATVRMVASSTVFGWSDRAGELETLVVAPHVRSVGVGARLLAALRSELAAHDVHEVVVHVLAGNDRAIDFYRREGFLTYQVMMSDTLPAALDRGER
jgi:ribosomal protein S18 acetylase RimI-like enzyme